MSIVAVVLDVICTYNEIFWLYKWVNIFLERRTLPVIKKKIEKIDWILWAAYVIIVFCLNRITLTSAYTMLIVMLMNLVAILCFWKCDMAQAFAADGGYFFALFLLGNIAITITGMIGGDELIQKCTAELGTARVIYLLVNGGLWYMINKYGTACISKRVIKPKNMRYVAYVSILGFIGSAFIGMMLVNGFSMHVGIIWYVFVILILIIGFGCYFFIKQKEAQFKMTVLVANNEMLEKNYMQIKAFYTKNAKLYHDMNHHLDAIYYLLQQGKQEQAKAYIENLHTQSRYTGIKVQSGIDVLDVVFYEMNLKAQRKGVMLTIETPLLPCDIGLKNGDICSLFSNLLENALEASVKHIFVQIKHVNRVLYVTVKNDCSVMPVKKEGKFVTLKPDKSLHGWGTQIVEQIVQKYEGSIEYEVVNGYFTVYAMLNEKLEE